MRATILSLLLVNTFYLAGQDIYEKYQQFVDPFTGDLQFTQPLMSISSSSGQSVPVILSYNSNVTTNQKASWVGLGFNLDMGEISRELNGFPDELSDFLQLEHKYDLLTNNNNLVSISTAGPVENIHGYGPMADYPPTSTATDEYIQDVLHTVFNASDGQYPSPNFDKFHVSSPRYGGTFNLAKPSFDPKTTYLKDAEFEVDGNTYEPATGSGAETEKYSRFQFENDPTGNVYVRYYKIGGINNGDYDLDDGFIRYRTEAGLTFPYSGNSHIGAFTIYLEDGTRLHYSLPVWTYAERNYEFRNKDDGTLDFNSKVKSTNRSMAYISSWKLTAITGADYKDLNNNGYPDAGDRGFWLNYYYSKSLNDLKDRTPLIGTISNVAAGTNVGSEDPKAKEYFHFTSTSTITEHEEYYLDKIVSDIQTLIFFKGVKEDDCKIAETSSGSSIYVPTLCLKSIVKYGEPGHSLTKNHTVAGVYTALNSINSEYANFRNATYFMDDYVYESDIILGKKDFNYNYSLCPGYYGNIRNIYGKSPSVLLEHDVDNPVYSFHDFVYDSDITPGTYGKLTLASISSYEYNATSIYDDLTFNYGNSNPAYDPNKSDDFGFYASRIASRNSIRDNLTSKPVSDIAPWSLTSIDFPSGINLKANYEFDRYTNNLSAYSSPNRSSIILPVKKMEVVSYTQEGSGADQRAYAQIKLYLFNTSDADYISSLASRKVKLVGQFFPCNGNTNYLAKVSGTRYYTGTGAVSSNSDLQVLSGPTNGVMTVKMKVWRGGNYNFNFNGLACEDMSPTALTGFNMFFEITDPEYIGGYRVSSLEVKENPLDQEKYTIQYQYGEGTIGSENGRFHRVKDTLLLGNGATPLNSLPSTTFYFHPTVKYLGLDGSVKEYTNYDYVGEELVVKRPATYTKSLWSENCVIDDSWLGKRISEIWIYINDENLVGVVPDLIDCYVRSYIIDQILPQTSGLSLGDVQEISNFLQQNPGWDWQIIYCPWGRDFTGHQLYCYSGSVYCNGVPQDPVANTDNLFTYMTYNQALAASPYYKFIGLMTDRSSLLGSLENVTSYDADDNKIAQTQYQYDDYAKYTESSYTKMFKNSTSDYVLYKLTTTREYFKPTKIYSYKKGFGTYTESVSLDAKYGKYKTITAASNTDNISEITKTFPARDGLGKISPVSLQLDPAEKDYKLTGIESSEVDEPANRNISSPFYTKEDLYGIGGYQAGYPVPSGNLLSSNEQEVVLIGAGDSYDQGGYQTTTQTAPTGWDELVVKGSKVYKNSELLAEQEVTLFSDDFTPLEVVSKPADIYTSTKYTENGRFPYASLANVRYKSFTATGFESLETPALLEGEVIGGIYRFKPTASDIGTAHTGKYVAKVPSGKTAFYYTHAINLAQSHLEAGRNYIASVWVHSSSGGTPSLKVQLSGSLNGGVGPYSFSETQYLSDAEVEVDGWKLLRISFTIPENYTAQDPTTGQGTVTYGTGDPETSITVSAKNNLIISLQSSGGTAYFDDLRFAPADAGLQVKIFDPVRGNVTEVLDAENFYTRQVYDEAGRVIEVYKETPDGVAKVQSNSYVNN